MPDTRPLSDLSNFNWRKPACFAAQQRSLKCELAYRNNGGTVPLETTDQRTLCVALGDALGRPAIGVGFAIVLMQALYMFHPPASINPVIITTAHATPLFVLIPVAVGALIQIAFARIYRRLAKKERWPERWL